MLRAIVSLLSKPGRKGFGSHISSAAIEKDDHWCGSTLKLVNPREQKLFAAKALSAAPRERGTTLEIEIGQLGEAVFRSRPLGSAGAHVR